MPRSSRPLLPLLFLVLAASAGCTWERVTDPEQVAGLQEVHVGDDFACAVGTDFNVRCWGTNRFGQLGDGSNTLSNTPTVVAGDLLFESMGVHGAGQHACAITTDHQAYCWGENHFGQIGDGTFRHTSRPVPVSGGLSFRSISAGWRFTCGLTTDLEAYCWGRGEWGQLGDGEAVGSTTPVKVAGNRRYQQIEAGSNNLVCAIEVGGALYCWGLDRAGNIGSPTTRLCTRSDGFRLPCAVTPTRVAPTLEFRDLAVGSSFACAVTRDSVLMCWGRNTSGQIGTTPTDQCAWIDGGFPVPCNPEPTAVFSNIRSASAGTEHVCVVALDDQGFCWGRNQFGEGGDGSLSAGRATPSRIAGDLRFQTISAGVSHSCGVTVDNNLYCWGVNDRGQIGDGTNRLALVPSRVQGGLGPT